MNNLQSIPIAEIDISDRLRAADDVQVESIKDSILEVGLLNPITVNDVDGRFHLVAGLHRVEAYKRLGHDEIPAIILELSDLEAVIAECDENLRRAELSIAERATFTAKRKDAYEAIHPEARHGTPDVSRQVGDTGERAIAERFTAATAKATGQSERSVQRDAERGEKVIPEALEMIRGTRLDTGTYIDKIKNLSPNDQVTAIRRDLVERPQGGIAGRYQTEARPDPVMAAEQFLSLADKITDLSVDDLVGSGRLRASVGQRASGLIDHLSDVMERIDR